MYIVDDFIYGDFYTKEGKLNGEILLYALLIFFGCVDGVQGVCARMVAIIHIETVVAFNFHPSLVSRLLTPIWTESDEFSGIS